MRVQANMRNQWAAITARSRDERGNAMAEYTPLLAVIALVVMFAIPTVGGSVSDLLGGAECPGGGGWTKQPVWAVVDGDKKQALEEDQNGNNDGMVCIKNPNGEPGDGNQGNNQNVKDNNG